MQEIQVQIGSNRKRQDLLRKGVWLEVATVVRLNHVSGQAVTAIFR
jgi:hypothetical protein